VSLTARVAAPAAGGGAVTAPVPVVFVGLGPIGRDVARVVAARPGYRCVGAVDVDPALAGLGLHDVLEVETNGEVTVCADLADVDRPEQPAIAVHCAESSLRRAARSLHELIAAGYHVVSTCEELAAPWHTQPDVAAALDREARANGVVLVGTGANPGYAMDYLPIVLAASQRSLHRVSVHRVQDAGLRRLPLQHRIGTGLSRASFADLVAAGMISRVGLAESVRMLDHALALRCSSFVDRIEPIVAAAPVTIPERTIPAGHVLGIEQEAVGLRGTTEVIRLRLELAVGLPDPRDEIVLDGEPGLRNVVRGLHGDHTTAAVVANSLARVLLVEPGLRTVDELPASPLHFGQA